MALFQKPAATPEEVERGRPLSIPPEVVDTFDEDTWYSRAYRGDAVPQLTVRAVLMGSLIGFLLAISNVYIGLKVGWVLPVALTACIVSFSLWTAFVRIGLARTPMSILENNCMQSTASSAGATTSQIVITAAPALLLLANEEHRQAGHIPWPMLATWIGFTALLGVVLAIPMKRNMINQERLKFPSGLAAAVTLQSLYSHGAEALRKARILLYAALVAGCTPILMDLNIRKSGPLLPSVSKVFDWLPARGKGFVPSDWTMVLDHKLVMIAGGAIVGLRVATAMLIGSLVLAYVVGPAALAGGAVTAPSQAWLEIGLWVGAPMLLAGGLLSLAFGWRTLVRAFRRAGGSSVAQREGDIPRAVFVVGLVVAGVAVVVMARFYFQTPVVLALFGVLLAFVLGIAICRAAGESDIMPLGPMATLTQLIYGGLVPHNTVINLASPATTVGAGSASADLLNDLKSGHLLGASPRRQVVAQLLGIIPGTIAVVVGYYLLVPDVGALTGHGTTPAQFPAPSAQMWLATAKLVTKGFGGLHPMAQLAVTAGALIGVALTLLERLPPRWAKWVPSPVGLGLGMVIPFQYAFSFFLGALIAWWWGRRRPEQAARFTVPVASGLIAGESLVGVAVALVNTFILRR